MSFGPEKAEQLGLVDSKEQGVKARLHIMQKPLSKSQASTWLDSLLAGPALTLAPSLVKGAEAALAGWQAAPASKKGAQRRRKGKGWLYRYPAAGGGWTTKKPDDAKKKIVPSVVRRLRRELKQMTTEERGKLKRVWLFIIAITYWRWIGVW